MREEILKIQKLMEQRGIDVYYIPSGDFHNSEYFSDYFKAREFVSGLTGEVGTLVITPESAHMWIDARFFLQADIQLAGSGIEQMRIAEPDVPTITEFLTRYAVEHKGFTLGFDGRVVPGSFGMALEKELRAYDVKIKCDIDLVDEIWEERPALKASRIYELPLSTTGKSTADKLEEVRSAMREKGADYLLLSDLTETAWILNMRGTDIEYTPVFFSYVLLSMDELHLYIMPESIDPANPYSIPNLDGIRDLIDRSPRAGNGLPEELCFVKVHDYNEIDDDIAGLPPGCTLWLNSQTANYLLYKSIPEGVEIVDEITPVTLLKAVKNPVEIAGTINAQAKDGAALLKFTKWIKEVAGETPRQTELSASEYLKNCRYEQPGCFDLSFGAIMGYGPNGAIIHYAPTPETDAVIEPAGFLLLDSGAHFIDGTTDITRTIKVGPLTQEMIDDYTYVLKSHIAMGTCTIEPGMTGIDLDTMTRKPMRDVGLDFKHGFSHGVGHLLSVHEGPNVLRRVPTPIELKPGMIMSDEPGYYKDGEFGIRIENEVLWQDAGEGRLCNTMVSYVPYEREAINKDLLTDEEIEWVNRYHAEVREKLSPLVDGELAEFLEYATAPL